MLSLLLLLLLLPPPSTADKVALTTAVFPREEFPLISRDGGVDAHG